MALEQGEITAVGGRTALITGASGGLGPAVVELFLAAGWRVVLPARKPEALEERFSPRAPEIVQADLAEEASVARAVATAAGEPSAPLRAVINLVGGFASGPRVADTSPEDFEALFQLNVRPTYLVTRAALPHLVAQGAGAIVSVSAQAAVRPFPGASAYIASKAAVIAFSSALAVEYGSSGVRSNVVLPSAIDTPANRAAQPGADRSRWADPSDIAQTIHFLASDTSRSVNGAAVPV
jgi:NAD(P)-dependent dehydrogenase (short-subunit alcohol dehydrogenase family)